MIGEGALGGDGVGVGIVDPDLVAGIGIGPGYLVDDGLWRSAPVVVVPDADVDVAEFGWE